MESKTIIRRRLAGVPSCVGWTLWPVEDGPLFAQTSLQHRARYGYAKASCGRGHPAPQKDCACGFFVFREFENACEWLNASLEGAPQLQVLMGMAQCAGRIIVTDYVYRAEYIRPLALIGLRAGEVFGFTPGMLNVFSVSGVNVLPAEEFPQLVSIINRTMTEVHRKGQLWFG